MRRKVTRRKRPRKKDRATAVNAFVAAGLSKKVALALAHIASQKEALSKDIELATGLRQPEVSLAVQELRRMGWVTKREIKRSGKGRPLHAYRLNVPLQDIIKRLVNREEMKIKKVRENISVLKSLVSMLSPGP